MSTTAPLPAFRSAGIVTAIFVIALAAHTAAGGVLPPPPLLLALGLLLMIPVTKLATGRFSPISLAVLLGLGQVVLHTAFTLASGATTSTAAAGTAGLHHHSPATTTGPDAAAHMAGDAPVLMLAAHVLAVAVTAMVLAKGETALWHMAAWLRPLLHILRPATLPAKRPAQSIHRAVLIPAQHRPLHSLGVRGPPRWPAPATAGN